MIRKAIWGVFIVVGILVFGNLSFAVEFPTRPIEWITPFGLGGISVALLRAVGDGMSKHLGQPVVITNCPGGGGIVGGTKVARAKPDGYTLLFASSSQNGYLLHLKKDVPYKNSDFEFLAEIGTMTLGLYVKPDAPYKTIEEYIDFAKKNSIKHATQYGTSHQLLMEIIKARVPGMKIDFVPFKDSGACMTAVLGGHVDSGFAYGGMGKADHFSRLIEGKARILAVSSKNRLKGYPNLPTLIEKGIMDVPYTAWYGIAAPKGLPKEVSQKLKDAIYKVLQDPKIMQIIEDTGFSYEFRKSEEFTKFVEDYQESTKKLFEEAKIELK